MKRGLFTTMAIAASLAYGSMSYAGNGSNYIHLLNGIDYFFLGAPGTGTLQGTWRCFPSAILHGPTRVVDPANPEVGNYASKVCAIHFSINGSPGGPLLFPTISISTNPGGCKFTQSGGAALNFGLASTGSGQVVVGPINGSPGTIALQVLVLGASITNPAAAAGTIVQLALNLTQLIGSPSTIPVPDGSAMTLWLQQNPGQTGPGNRMYWSGSLDERNICSGFSFLLTGTGLAIGFNPAWEWSAGIGTLAATMTNVVTSTGGGPSNLNAHAGSAFAQPFDQGSGAMSTSITGTTGFPATSTAGEIMGFAHYDEGNAFGGSGRLVFINLMGLSLTGQGVCNLDAPTTLLLPSGGPGGPALSPLGQNPRVVGKVDAVTNALFSGGFWILATNHSGVAGGSNIPWFPAGAGISGSTGNTGGFAIPVPPLPSLVGLVLFFSSAPLNASGTAIAVQSNNGNSFSNGVSTLCQP